MRNIIVVGGGASGMAAAITAARAGADVTILEQNDILGKKILSTGNGRCNLTNLDLKVSDYRSDHLQLIQDVLASFDTQDALDFFDSLGICTKFRGDYVYPLCDQATSVRDAFVNELRRLNVHIVTGCHVEQIIRKKKEFHVYCRDSHTCYKASALILAAGSKASEISGSDGSGYDLAKSLGHSLSPVVPALVQLRAKGNVFKKLSGIRMNATVSLYVDHKLTAQDTGELQLTDYGISGIPVFQISRYAAKALRTKNKVTVKLDLIPGLKEEELLTEILGRRMRWKQCTSQEILNTLFPSKLIPVLLNEANIPNKLWAEKLSEERWDDFTKLCKEFEIQITETNPFGKAQVCAGGVRTEEIDSKTMESILVKDLYITGELLDVDGICGGYNLHFAWATGILAGAHAAK